MAQAVRIPLSSARNAARGAWNAFVTRIALTTYGESGPAKELADDYGFSPEAIAQKVIETLNK